MKLFANRIRNWTLILSLVIVVFVFWFNEKSKGLKVAKSRVKVQPHYNLKEAKVVPNNEDGRTINRDSWQPETAISVAQTYLEKNRSAWKIQPHHQLIPKLYESPLGTSVVYQFSQDGIPIVGMRIEIGVSKDKQVVSSLVQYSPIERVPLEVTGSGERISRMILVQPGGQEGVLAYAQSVAAPSLGDSRSPSEIAVRASDGRILRRTYSRKEF